MSGSSLNQFNRLYHGKMAQKVYNDGYEEGRRIRVALLHGMVWTTLNGWKGCPYKTTNRRVTWFNGYEDAMTFKGRRVFDGS